MRLAAWAQTHRPFPLHYVPDQRETTAAELPVYLDRHEGEDAFILRTLSDEPDVPGILEANGGATLWSRGDLLDLARLILIVEEGARAQTLAEPLGGARDFGPAFCPSSGMPWAAATPHAPGPESPSRSPVTPPRDPPRPVWAAHAAAGRCLRLSTVAAQ
ncbi:hypothetical protein [Actinacidiphila oryziradicis]|uniref:Uncharacterized protein n=1 Tax=Actinacidiphila oryziradicis TaxID=2571141 RepID=A0A4U0R5Y7_9ACTN|nr:hypothetical protein [Actinacidiphila oryziradicis]TJZ90287.1 hypothetical protein FCI23_55855 [Actinacidiphila oryziradicis]